MDSRPDVLCAFDPAIGDSRPKVSALLAPAKEYSRPKVLFASEPAKLDSRPNVSLAFEPAIASLYLPVAQPAVTVAASSAPKRNSLHLFLGM